MPCPSRTPRSRSAGADDRHTLAEALEYADLCAVELGLPAGERAEQALAIYEELGDLAAQARVQNTLGMLAYHRGEWPKALEHYEASESADIRCGKLWNAATPAANRAEILADQGRLDEAWRALEEAMLTWRGVNAVSMIAFGEYQLGRIAARLGDTGGRDAPLRRVTPALQRPRRAHRGRRRRCAERRVPVAGRR